MEEEDAYFYKIISGSLFKLDMYSQHLHCHLSILAADIGFVTITMPKGYEDMQVYCLLEKHLNHPYEMKKLLCLVVNWLVPV